MLKKNLIFLLLFLTLFINLISSANAVMVSSAIDTIIKINNTDFTKLIKSKIGRKKEKVEKKDNRDNLMFLKPSDQEMQDIKDVILNDDLFYNSSIEDLDLIGRVYDNFITEENNQFLINNKAHIIDLNNKKKAELQELERDSYQELLSRTEKQNKRTRIIATTNVDFIQNNNYNYEQEERYYVLSQDSETIE